MHLKMLSAKSQLFCVILNKLMIWHMDRNIKILPAFMDEFPHENVWVEKKNHTNHICVFLWI